MQLAHACPKLVWGGLFEIRPFISGYVFVKSVFKNWTHDAFLIWPSVALVKTLVRTRTCEHPVIWVWWFLAMICWPWICWATTARRRRRTRWILMFVRLGDFWLLTRGKSDVGFYCERRDCDIEAYCMGCVTILAIKLLFSCNMWWVDCQLRRFIVRNTVCFVICHAPGIEGAWIYFDRVDSIAVSVFVNIGWVWQIL